MTNLAKRPSAVVRVLRWAWLALTVVLVAGLIAGSRSLALALLMMLWMLLGLLLASDPAADRLVAWLRAMPGRVVGRG